MCSILLYWNRNYQCRIPTHFIAVFLIWIWIHIDADCDRFWIGSKQVSQWAIFKSITEAFFQFRWKYKTRINQFYNFDRTWHLFAYYGGKGEHRKKNERVKFVYESFLIAFVLQDKFSLRVSLAFTCDFLFFRSFLFLLLFSFFFFMCCGCNFVVWLWWCFAWYGWGMDTTQIGRTRCHHLPWAQSLRSTQRINWNKKPGRKWKTCVLTGRDRSLYIIVYIVLLRHPFFCEDRDSD